MDSTILCGRNRLRTRSLSNLCSICIAYLRADTDSNNSENSESSGARRVASLFDHNHNDIDFTRPQMSARQPFLPSRPASRALNTGDDAGTTRVALSSLPSDTNDSAELGVKCQSPHGDLERDTNTQSTRKPLALSTSPLSKNPLRALQASAPPRQNSRLPKTRTRIRRIAMPVGAIVQQPEKAPPQGAYMRLIRPPHPPAYLDSILKGLRCRRRSLVGLPKRAYGA